MNNVNENIVLKLEEGTSEDDFIDNCQYVILIYLNDVEIGYIDGYATDENIHIELITLNGKYRRKGYGTLVLKELKEIAVKLGIKYIDGECQTKLKPFYEKLGADFSYREKDDETYINHRFYIDI